MNNLHRELAPISDAKAASKILWWLRRSATHRLELVHRSGHRFPGYRETSWPAG